MLVANIYTVVEVKREGATAPYLILIFFSFLRATFRLDLDHIRELFNCNCLQILSVTRTILTFLVKILSLYYQKFYYWLTATFAFIWVGDWYLNFSKNKRFTFVQYNTHNTRTKKLSGERIYMSYILWNFYLYYYYDKIFHRIYLSTVDSKMNLKKQGLPVTRSFFFISRFIMSTILIDAMLLKFTIG